LGAKKEQKEKRRRKGLRRNKIFAVAEKRVLHGVRGGGHHRSKGVLFILFASPEVGLLWMCMHG
jgi:hypothetical protein